MDRFSLKVFIDPQVPTYLSIYAGSSSRYEREGHREGDFISRNVLVYLRLALQVNAAQTVPWELS